MEVFRADRAVTVYCHAGTTGWGPTFGNVGCAVIDTPPPIIRMYSGMHPGITVSNSAMVGYTYVIQGTADLTQTNGWTTVASFTWANVPIFWMDTNINAALPANAQHFYRVLRGQ